MKYKLVRSKRKTLSICVKDGEVTVKAPKSSSVEYIEKFIAQKESWINKKLAEFKTRSGLLRPVLDGECVMLDGNVIPIVISDGVKRAKLSDGALIVPETDGDAQKKAIAAWYKRTAKNSLCHSLEGLSVLTGLKYKSFAITNARTKWGSCDGECNIRLNWRLIMLNERLAEYVIVHELCHTVHHDHSAAFWEEVAKHCPDYKNARKSLKTYGALTSLYR